MSSVFVIPVSPWGNCTPALNTLLSHASEFGFSHILFQSFELSASKQAVDLLSTELRSFPHALVCGAELPGHNFAPGFHAIHGLNSPWNTLSIWSVKDLVRTGFLTVSECIPEVDPGMEEVAAISLLQFMAANTPKARIESEEHIPYLAILIRSPKSFIQWTTDWSDPKRREWHQKKMESKLKRASSQMHYLGIVPGVVLHVDRS